MEKNATVVLKTHNRIDKSDYVKGKISYSELNPKYFKAWEWAGQRDREIERGGGCECNQYYYIRFEKLCTSICFDCRN